jgi:hypothetical protein
MKELLSVLLLCATAYSQTEKENYISYNRMYYNNKEIISTVNDAFKLKMDFKNDISLYSNFSIINLKMHNQVGYFNDKEIEKLYSYDLGINKTIAFKENWKLSFFLNPQIRSNFNKELNSDDFLLNASIGTEKYFTKSNSSIKFSVDYGTLFGKPSVYIQFELNKKINDNYNFSIGFPKTFFEYNVNQKNSFKILASYDTYYTNISDNTVSRYTNGESKYYSSLFLSKINTTLGYNYKFSDNSIIDISIGKSFGNELKISENNDNEITKYKYNNDFIVSMGFKYNLNFK